MGDVVEAPQLKAAERLDGGEAVHRMRWRSMVTRLPDERIVAALSHHVKPPPPPHLPALTATSHTVSSR
jgi:hypothetical protein